MPNKSASSVVSTSANSKLGKGVSFTNATSYDAVNTPVDANNKYRGVSKPLLNMIENYVYFYHTDTLIVLPIYPESIADSMAVSFDPTTPLSSTAPTYSYRSSGPRSFDITLPLHRELMTSINSTTSTFIKKVPQLVNTATIKDDTGADVEVTTTNHDYVDILVNQLRGAALPKFSSADMKVDPPIIAVRFGNDIFCKGVVGNGVTITYSAPILADGRYAQVNVNFSINEIIPFDATTAMTVGGYRGYDLQGKI